MKTLIEESMIDICKEESVSPKQVFFGFLCCLCCLLYRYGLSKHNFFALIKGVTQGRSDLFRIFESKVTIF